MAMLSITVFQLLSKAHTNVNQINCINRHTGNFHIKHASRLGTIDVILLGLQYSAELL